MRIRAPSSEIKLPPMKDLEIRPNIIILEEPTPIPGTNKLRALANVEGNLCLIELALKFKEEETQ